MRTVEGSGVLLEGHCDADGVWCCVSEIWGKRVMGRALISQERFKGPFLLCVQSDSAPKNFNRVESIHSAQKALRLRANSMAEPWVGPGLGFLLVRPV